MKKKTRSIEEIKSEIQALDRKRDVLQAIIDDRESRELLPKLKKKYEGKYFLSESDGVIVYRHCAKVTSKWAGLANAIFFEQAVSSIREQKPTNLYLFQESKQITRREYLAALKKFKSQLDKLGK